LRDSNIRLAQSLGQDAQSLIDNGFLDADDVDDLQFLADLESQDFTDPRLENQLNDERARLEQDLRRQGASAAVRAQALANFDRTAEESRFTRAEELRTGAFQRTAGRIDIRSGLRQSNLQRSLAGFNAGLTSIDSARAGIDQLGQINAAAFQGAITGQAVRGQLRDARFNQFAQLGQFDFGKRVRGLIESGVIGPGRRVQTLDEVGDRIRRGEVRPGALSNEELLQRARSFNNTAATNVGQIREEDLTEARNVFESLNNR